MTVMDQALRFATEDAGAPVYWRLSCINCGNARETLNPRVDKRLLCRRCGGAVTRERLGHYAAMTQKDGRA